MTDTPEAAPIKDSGSRTEFSTGAIRDSLVGKPRPELISPIALYRLAIHLGKGAAKYADRNWEKGIPLSHTVGSAKRHLDQYLLGETDEDHLAAFFCNSMFLLHTDDQIRKGNLPASLNDLPDYTSPERAPEEAPKEGIGHWVETYSGLHVDLLDPQPFDIVINDIAWSLSNQCRFTGHVPISIAQHCINMVRLAERDEMSIRIRLLLLMHDAQEAYLGDISRPLKKLLPRYKELEDRMQSVIFQALDIDPITVVEQGIINDYDNRELLVSAFNFMPSRGIDWNVGTPDPDDIALLDNAPEDALEIRTGFLNLYLELSPR